MGQHWPSALLDRGQGKWGKLWKAKQGESWEKDRVLFTG